MTTPQVPLGFQPNGSTPLPPISSEEYLCEEREHQAGRRSFEQIMEARRRYHHSSESWPAMEAAWTAQEAQKHQTPVESAPLPLAVYAAPIPDNMNARGNLARLIKLHGPRLVVALPDPGDPADSPADIYGLTPNGVISRVAARSYYEDVQTRYIQDATPAPDENGNRRSPTGSKLFTHALECNQTRNWRELLSEAASAIHYWIENKVDLNGLVVRRKSDANYDLTAVGTPQGVLDLLTGRLLSPEEGRQRFITASIPDLYDPSARHPACDAILPPVGSLVLGSVEMYRALVLALIFTRPPRREMLVEICAAGSGKSTFANAILSGWGPSYAGTIPIESLLEPRFKSRVANEHNGERYVLTRPSRIAFSTESSGGGRLDADFTKRVTGGDPITIRAIRQAPEQHVASAHLWIQGNLTDEGGLELGLAGDDENSQALRDRAKLLPRDRIPEEKQVSNWVELGYQDTDEALQYRQAVVARIVEYCRSFAGLEWPADLPEMVELLEEQREAERELWESEWLPNCLIHQEGAVTPTASVYANFMAWMARNEPTTRDLKGQKTITARVARQYGVRATRERVGDSRPVRAFKGLAIPPISLFAGDFHGDAVPQTPHPQQILAPQQGPPPAFQS